jgi:glutamate carboxypeptidase
MPRLTASLRRTAGALTLAAALLPLPARRAASQPALTAAERRIREHVAAASADQVDFLGRVVDIGSGTMNAAGVRRVGDVFRAAFDSLGFTTRWVDMPASMNRAGHLIAEHRGRAGGKRLLLIGHLDTVFEGEGQQFARTDSMAKGAGTSDMKGGDVIVLYALRAMQRAGVLADANVTVVFTGDEESAGDPLAVARRDLIELARQSDAALAFEGGNQGDAVVARRGFSSWMLRVTGRQGHSSGIFSEGAGYGAIYEAGRILDEFRRAFSGEANLTVNPGVIVGGTDVTFDSAHVSGTTAGKLNIVARSVMVPGDLRFLSEEQKERTRTRMREIAARNLPGTSAELSFQDEYPAMSPTPGNYALLAVYDSVSRALGHGPVVAYDPGRRGAGDVSFVAPFVDGLDGLGALGSGSHSPDERVNLAALPMQTERAALLLYRLSRQAPRVRK